MTTQPRADLIRTALTLTAQGLSARKIGQHLGVDRRTVVRWRTTREEDLMPRNPTGSATAWQRDASCASTDPDEWYPAPGNGAGYLRRICGGCPVETQCLDYVMATEPNSARYGIWAGLDPEERRALHRERRDQAQAATGLPAPVRARPSGRSPSPCGTRGAYDRHVRNGEPIDPLCQAAHEENLVLRREQARRRAEQAA